MVDGAAGAASERDRKRVGNPSDFHRTGAGARDLNENTRRRPPQAAREAGLAARTGKSGRGGARAPKVDAVERDLALLAMETDLAALRWRVAAREGRPEGWSDIARSIPTRPRRQTITLLVDEDVARWRRRQGEGYQARIIAVLRLSMVAKTTGKI